MAIRVEGSAPRALSRGPVSSVPTNVHAWRGSRGSVLREGGVSNGVRLLNANHARTDLDGSAVTAKQSEVPLAPSLRTPLVVLVATSCRLSNVPVLLRLAFAGQ